MAWRIDEQVIRGEIDSRTRDRVTGRIWFVGLDDPVVLDLAGNPYRDLAGHVLRFTNPAPKPADLSGLNPLQLGVTGDITASRKVKVPDCSMAEFEEHYRKREPFPWHWGNSLYLEWFSHANGRVVIESSAFVLDLDAAGAWDMSEEEEQEQRAANGRALVGFMDLLTQTVADAHEAERMATMAELEALEDDDDEDDDGPQSRTEAEADAQDEWMNTLQRRVVARLRREGRDYGEFDKIYQEERARLNRERGIVEPELTEEQLEERARWIEEMNEICSEALEDQVAEAWKGAEEEEDHPLQQRCFELGIALHHQLENNGWVTQADSPEHPLWEVQFGVQIASAKLAGALTGANEEWPPNPLFAGDKLVRLKKARGHLRDALSGLDAADQGNLATTAWRNNTRAEVAAILGGVRELIREVRAALADGEEE